MAKKSHFEKCRAPICLSNKRKGWKDDIVWYPGEKVCKRAPYTRIQKNQKKINKLLKEGDFVHEGRYFTAKMLEDRDKITSLTRGADPND